MPNGSGHDAPVLKVYGKVGSAACYALRDFLYRNGVPYEWIELTSDEQAKQIGLEGINDSRLPAVVFPDGTRLEAPSAVQVAGKLGWQHDPSRSEYDLAILRS